MNQGATDQKLQELHVLLSIVVFLSGQEDIDGPENAAHIQRLIDAAHTMGFLPEGIVSDKALEWAHARSSHPEMREIQQALAIAQGVATIQNFALTYLAREPAGAIEEAPVPVPQNERPLPLLRRPLKEEHAPHLIPAAA